MASKVVNGLTATLFLILAVAGIFYLQTGPCFGTPGEYEQVNLTLEDRNGTALAAVTARIADTGTKRCVGLSNTESLDDGEGMLFVHDESGEYGYVMRDMAFPLDIVFIDANGTVTTVHHAPLPPAGTSNSELARYRGEGRYVLELPMGVANETGLDAGDRVVIPEDVAA